MSRTVTSTSAALADLVQTLEALQRLYQACKHREPTDQEDRRMATLEHRSALLEAQIKREVEEALGVNYGVLWAAVQG